MTRFLDTEDRRLTAMRSLVANLAAAVVFGLKQDGTLLRCRS
jgi:hypothetical protein